jgi:hypothetical protein
MANTQDQEREQSGGDGTLGRYDLAYEVVVEVLHEKSAGLEAYEQYLLIFGPNEDVREERIDVNMNIEEEPIGVPGVDDEPDDYAEGQEGAD